MTRSLPTVTIAVLIGLLGLTAANLAYERWHEPGVLNPIAFHKDADLGHLILAGRETILRRAGIYADLRAVSDGGELVAPPDSRLLADYALVVAGLDLVVDDAYDPHVDDDAYEVLRVQSHRAGELWRDAPDDPYLVVEPVDPAAAERWRVLLHDRTLIVADEHTLSVLDVGWRGDP